MSLPKRVMAGARILTCSLKKGGVTIFMPDKKDFVHKKISKIMEEGVRKNTHAPVSASNPRRPVSRDQAIAIALDMRRRMKS